VKKIVLVITLLLIAAFLLAACGVPTTPTAGSQMLPTEKPAVEPTKAVPPTEVKPTAEPTKETAATPASAKRKVVYFIGFGTGTAPAQLDGQKALIKRFNDSHPDIEVEIMIVPNEEAIQRFTAMAASGNPPEILGAAGFATIGVLGDTGVIQDLGPFIEKSKFDTSIFYGPVVDIMKSFFPTGQKALPFGIYPTMVFYNKDMFDAAGLPYPPHDYNDMSWTYAKVREYAMKMTLDKNGNDATSADFDPTQIAQWGFDDSWTDMRNYLTMWGAPGVGMVTTADMKTAIINQKEWVTGLQWLSDGIWKDHFIPDAAGQATYGAVGNGDPFSTGLDAMFLTHTWFMPEGLTGITFKYDLAPVPVAPTGKRIVRTDVDGFAMIKGSDQQEAAWEFMSWLVQPDQIVDVCLIYGCLPPIKSVEAKFRGIMEQKWPGLDYDVIYNGLNHLDNPHSDAYVVEQQKIGDVMNNALTEVYAGSQKDAKVLLDKVNVDVQKILDDYWAKQK
jgi:multiple sugar transport system substrate-binding protein